MSTSVASRKSIEILLVEDNDNDVVLTREGFRRANLFVTLQHVGTGEECIAYLRKQGKHAGAASPDLILLDLNLPTMDGREVLAELVEDDGLCHLPVVILTTSAQERDILNMYKLRCSSYITKPVDFDEFVRVVRQFSEYWFSVVVLPPAER